MMHAERTPEKQEAVPASPLSQRRAGSSPVLVDLRPSTAAQRRLQDIAESSPQQSRLRATRQLVDQAGANRTPFKSVSGGGSGVVQKFDPLKTPREDLNANGKAAYDLLINDRAEFKKIDKKGGDVNAEQDSMKRVTKAWKPISSVRADRNQTLQTTIGWLGNLEAEDTSAGYNGGHLIASSLGGSGTWQNMVPQDGPENKWGDWRKYEKENAKALQDTGAGLICSIKLGYTGDSVLPSSWDSWLTDKNGKDVNWYSGLFTL